MWRSLIEFLTQDPLRSRVDLGVSVFRKEPEEDRNLCNAEDLTPTSDDHANYKNLMNTHGQQHHNNYLSCNLSIPKNITKVIQQLSLYNLRYSRLYFMP